MRIAAAALLMLLFVALFGERLAPHEPIYFVLEHAKDPRPYDPGVVFPFGSDVLGRDLFSLVLAGARATLTIVLLAGLARVGAGVLVAALGSRWRPLRPITESAAELVSAVPATLVALVLVKVFVRAETSVLVFIGALLLMGWAGPYRVARAEIDRLAHAPFTEGARALGIGRWRLFWRHQIPHLVPVLAIDLSQQVIASLVLVAELGVLGAFVGTTRGISVEESLSLVITGQPVVAQLGDPPEWGGLLANARTAESLWATRWLILVPGIAFALTAAAVAVIGLALARRYARRDLLRDLRGRGAAALALAIAALVVASALVPERYAEARTWASAARAQLVASADVGGAFAEAGLRPVAERYAVDGSAAVVVQSAAASATVGRVTVTEPWPRRASGEPDPSRTARAFLTGTTGGGVVEAPLVFAGRGISQADMQPVPQPFGAARRSDHAEVIRDNGYADDYAGIDVRGKVVLLVRFAGIRVTQGGTAGLGDARGPLPHESIAKAVARRPAAVIFVDPALPLYAGAGAGGIIRMAGDVPAGLDPYLRDERDDPPVALGGVPVLVVNEAAAARLVGPLGLDLAPLLGLDADVPGRYAVSPSRELGVVARVEVPLERRVATLRSYVGEAEAPRDAARVLVWAIRRPDAPARPGDVIAAVARATAGRGAPIVFVDFDPGPDPIASTKAIRELLKDRRISLVVVLDRLDGSALRFTTANGDLIPAFDRYAERSGARFSRTLGTARIDDLGGLAPLPDTRTVVVRGDGGDGDLRPDAAALVGYLAGRLALGAEEVPR